MKPIAISKPSIGKNEIKKVISVLKSGMLSQGKYVQQFEDDFANYIRVKCAVAVCNGTAALFVALQSLGIKTGDEVVTTPFTFAANVEAILFTGATPVFVDIDPNTYNIDPSQIEQAITPKTKAILPVHLYGLPCDMNSIMRTARNHNLKVIEDCAQASGATLKFSKSPKLPRLLRSLKERKRWKKVGSIGDAGCFSFYATKNMTTGEGGMITTNSAKISEICRLLKSHGSKQKYKHQSLGFNFRMTDIQAALGVVQLQKLESLNQIRNRNAEFLNVQLAEVQGITLPQIYDGMKHVYHQYTIRVKRDFPISRDLLLKKFRKKGIQSEIYYPLPLHKQLFIAKVVGKKNYPNAEKAAKEVLSIPIHPGLTKKDLEDIVSVIKKVVK